MTTLRAELVSRGDLRHFDRDAMHALLDRCFEGATRDQFEADLAGKDFSIVMRDETGIVRGFTTLALERVEVAGVPLRVCYSGDTIVERAYWGSPALASTWIASVNAIANGMGGGELVWLLICSGPRTYRFLPVFFREFYPRYDRSVPPAIAERMAYLAERRYGAAYDQTRGLVVLPRPQVLRPELSALPVRRDQHVEHFERMNPQYRDGAELVCYASLEDESLTRAGSRMLAFGRRTLAPNAMAEAAE